MRRSSGLRERIHSPMYVSLRPPPYASAVSSQVSPAAYAASSSSNACSRFSPWPKNAGAEPMPPKFPHPTITRGYARPMATTLFDVASARARFSSLTDGGFVFLDAPGGSQVPDEVGDAIARTLREASANNGAPYATSKRVEAIYDQARVDAGRFLNCSPDDVIFGANMTTL